MSAELGLPLPAFAALKLEGVDQDLPVLVVSERLAQEAELPPEEICFIVASEVANPAAPAPELVPGLSIINSPRLGVYSAHRIDGAIVIQRPEELELYLASAGSLYLARAERLDLAALRERRRSECC
jgi:hypothetical protein